MSLKRRERRNQELMQKELNKPFTTTRKAINDMIQQAENKLSKNISVVSGYMLASVLEQEHDFNNVGIKRSIDLFMKMMYETVSCGVDINDHIEYWNDKGLKVVVEEEKVYADIGGGKE